MFDTIAPRYDLLNRLMTLGLDQGWRREAIAQLDLAPSSVVLDLACGTGDLLAALRRGGHRAFGADLSLGMLRFARPALPRVQADGSCLPLSDEALDGVVSGFALRNFSDLPAVFAELFRVLRPGGRLSLLEVDQPTHPLLKLGHRLWFTAVVPRLGALLSDGAAYRYLPRSASWLPPFDRLRGLLHEAGFEQVERRRLTGGIVQVVTASSGRRRHRVEAPRP